MRELNPQEMWKSLSVLIVYLIVYFSLTDVLFIFGKCAKRGNCDLWVCTISKIAYSESKNKCFKPKSVQFSEASCFISIRLFLSSLLSWNAELALTEKVPWIMTGMTCCLNALLREYLCGIRPIQVLFTHYNLTVIHGFNSKTLQIRVWGRAATISRLLD